MELIKEIYEKDLDLGADSGQARSIREDMRYRLRKAARALVFFENKIAILNAEKLNLHKLPGGGIDPNESIEGGLTREIREETGCKISDVAELGITIEYRGTIQLLQISYVFTGNVLDRAETPNFTEKELGEGFRLVWLTVPEAINIMKNDDNPNTYSGKFINERDLGILEYYVRRKI